jgi:hypothetical protein
VIQTYEEVFAKIRDRSGVSSLEELTKIFIEECARRPRRRSAHG